jgi:hypothetical protein
MELPESVLADMYDQQYIPVVVAVQTCKGGPWITIWHHIDRQAHTCKTVRGKPRQFKQLSTLADWLRSLGVDRFEVNLDPAA